MGGLGLVLPTIPQDSAVPDAAQLGRICRSAEAAGASALWAVDHLFWHGPVLECLAALTVAATCSERAVIGSCVLQLPLRRTAAVAKQVTAIRQLGGDRVVLGVGVGVHRGEYEAAGVAYSGRGRRLDAGIDELRRLWAGHPCGENPAERPASSAPADRYRQLPAGAPPPVWVGGSSEAALRRAVQRGDGWIPLFVAPDDYRLAMDRLDKEAERVGRDPRGIARAITTFVSVGGDDAHQRGCEWLGSLYRLPPKAFARHLVAGDARSCAGQLARWVEAGAEHVAVYMATDEPLVTFAELSQQFAGIVASGRAPGMVAQ